MDYSDNPTLLVQQARGGDTGALQRLLELYRNYLRLLAGAQMGQRLQARVDESDLVQETLWEAFRDFADFKGNTERQFMAWLRMILVRNLANLANYHSAGKRDLGREIPQQADLDLSSQRLETFAVARTKTPSAIASRRELAVVVADALSNLPRDYRQVMMMRHMQERPFGDIARQMNRTPGAVRMLWVRALECLRTEVEKLL